MTRHVGFLLFPKVQQLDLTAPYEVFAGLPNTRLHLFSKTMVPVAASTGLQLLPTTTFGACEDLDVFCIPGGAGVNALLTDVKTLDFVRRQAKQTRYLTSVCTGALVLGAAGLLRGKRATTHWNALDLLPAYGAIPVKDRVVRDGNLFTGGGVTAGIDFALTVIAEIAGRAEAEAIQLGLEYAPAPPFRAGTPETAPEPVVAAVRKRMAAIRKKREELAAAFKAR